MSIICAETNLRIERELRIATSDRMRSPRFRYCLSEETIGRIPHEERRNIPCQPGDFGIDIYEASAEGNGKGGFTVDAPLHHKEIEVGSFCFSISRQTLKARLPELAKKIEGFDVC